MGRKLTPASAAARTGARSLPGTGQAACHRLKVSCCADPALPSRQHVHTRRGRPVPSGDARAAGAGGTAQAAATRGRPLLGRAAEPTGLV